MERPSLLKTLSGIDLLIINDEEARQLAAEQNLFKAAEIILEMGPKTLVIKRGEFGAILFNSGSIFSIPAFPVEEVLDPTGAGDSFAGGLMGYLAASGKMDDMALRKAVAFGSVMASFNVMNFGPQQLGDLTYPEIVSRYHEFHRVVFFEDIA